MSFQYCPMLDYSENATIAYDDNLLSSIIPANMIFKQQHIVTDDLLLTAGYYPQMPQDMAAMGYPSDAYSSCSSTSSNGNGSSGACDLTYYAHTDTDTDTDTDTHAHAHTHTHAHAHAHASAACSSSPSSHCSYDSLYSPADSLTSFDFFPPNTAYNDPSLYEYWSTNISATAMATNTFPSTSPPPTPSSSAATLCSTTESPIDGRPYACPSCSRAFARKHDLQRHIRVHTGDKPYMCPCCRKRFARTDALKRHLRMEEQCRQSDQVQAMKETGRRRYRNL